VLIAVADAASHDVPLSVFWILSTTVAFAAGVASATFALTGQVGGDVVIGPKETSWVQFSFSLALPLTTTKL
jgi:hypothetical protein